MHDNLGPFSEFCQDSDTDIFDRIAHNAKIRGADLSDSYSNSGDDHASVNVGCSDDGGGSGCSGGYDKDTDNEDWAL
jgi:hypothetical protein